MNRGYISSVRESKTEICDKGIDRKVLLNWQSMSDAHFLFSHLFEPVREL